MKKKGFFEEVYKIVKTIPQGKVATYGQIALLMGRPLSSRFVGYALNKNPYPIKVPCHRVVNRFGYLAGGFAFGGIEIQKQLLEKEGVFVNDENCVNLEKYQWQPTIQK